MNVVRCYRIVEKYGDDPDAWFPTLAAVREDIHSATPELRSMYAVEECQVPADKKGVLDLLKGGPTVSVLRRWNVTARGGLKPVDLTPKEQP